MLRSKKSLWSKRKRPQFAEGWQFLEHSLRFLVGKPGLLVPIFVIWIVQASITLYLRYYFPVPHNLLLEILAVLAFILCEVYVMCLANLMLLELVWQTEENKNVSFARALLETLSVDAIMAMPLAVFYSIVWLICLILNAITRGVLKRGPRPEPSIRDAALTLSGISATPTSWFGLGLEVVKDLARMTVFLALPAIAWDNKGPISASTRAIEIIKKHPIEFLTTYALTEVAIGIMAIPLIPIFLAFRFEIQLPELLWTLVILYEGIVWTLGIYLEQMSVALLYLWHSKWERGGARGNLSSYVKPGLLADFYRSAKASR